MAKLVLDLVGVESHPSNEILQLIEPKKSQPEEKVQPKLSLRIIESNDYLALSKIEEQLEISSTG